MTSRNVKNTASFKLRRGFKGDFFSFLKADKISVLNSPVLSPLNYCVLDKDENLLIH
jgi:hypothetical protein